MSVIYYLTLFKNPVSMLPHPVERVVQFCYKFDEGSNSYIDLIAVLNYDASYAKVIVPELVNRKQFKLAFDIILRNDVQKYCDAKLRKNIADGLRLTEPI